MANHLLNVARIIAAFAPLGNRDSKRFAGAEACLLFGRTAPEFFAKRFQLAGIPGEEPGSRNEKRQYDCQEIREQQPGVPDEIAERRYRVQVLREQPGDGERGRDKRDGHGPGSRDPRSPRAIRRALMRSRC
jgi:hypothetical protein